MLLFWIAIIGALACIIVGIKLGFYIIFQTLFNTLVSIYVGIMLTPRLVGLIPEISNSQYNYPICVAGIAVILFIVMQTITACFLTGISDVTFPAIFDKIGAGALGFILGYVVLNFVIVLLYAMPFTRIPTMEKMVFKRTHTPHAFLATAKACNFVGTISLQYHDGEVDQSIEWLTETDPPARDNDDQDSGITDEAKKRREKWKQGPEITPQ